MAKAKQPGGLYYIGDQAVDADGKAIDGAPEKPKDTDPSLQPGALGAPTPEEKMGQAIARAILDPKGTAASTPAPAARSAAKPENATASGTGDTERSADADADGEAGDEDAPLPKIADLADHLETLTTAKAVKALQKKDERVGAQKLYEARLEELKSGE